MTSPKSVRQDALDGPSAMSPELGRCRNQVKRYAEPSAYPFAGVKGLVDDALVVSMALGAVRDDLDAFMGWETSQS
jgi:hypothetical protein